MLVIKVNEKHNLDKLFSYWNRLGEMGAPHFLKVTQKRWEKALFHDTYRGRSIFSECEIYYVMIQNQVEGFIQHGMPTFHYEADGIIDDPQIGVIRNLYFNKSNPQVGSKLLSLAEDYFTSKGLKEIYGFYHSMGMCCNAKHGKLHQGFKHVEDLLLENKFNIEHENIYYLAHLDKVQRNGFNNVQLEIGEKNQFHMQSITAFYNETQVGGAEVAYLEEPTGEATLDVIYLRWLWVKEEYRGQGIGNYFLEKIQNHFRSQGYKWMHLDTAITNIGAQRLYEKNGFINAGVTRSYVRKNSNS